MENHNYPVIVRILEFLNAPPLVGNYIITGDPFIAPPVSQTNITGSSIPTRRFSLPNMQPGGNSP